MKHEKEFKRLLEECRKEGLVFPELTYHDDLRNYDGCLVKESSFLRLETCLDIIVDLNITDKLKMNSITDVSSLTLEPKLYFGSIYDMNSSFYGQAAQKIEPKDWHALPRRFQEGATLIDRIDKFFSSTKVLAFSQMDDTSKELYSKLVVKGNLRWIDLMGEQFPYVVTNFQAIGEIGKSDYGLYFVATDIACEPWQEQIVAFHERFCQEEGHEYAREKEDELARHLGKEKEHGSWRKKIDQSPGKYFSQVKE